MQARRAGIGYDISHVDVTSDWISRTAEAWLSISLWLYLPHSAGEAEDLAFVGQLHYYDKAYDRVTPKADKPLRRTRRQFRTMTASRDPILQCACFTHL